jgi:hypothetical protein
MAVFFFEKTPTSPVRALSQLRSTSMAVFFSEKTAAEPAGQDRKRGALVLISALGGVLAVRKGFYSPT